MRTNNMSRLSKCMAFTLLLLFGSGLACVFEGEKDRGEIDKADATASTPVDKTGKGGPTAQVASNPFRVQKRINPAFRVRFNDFCGYPNCKACHTAIALEYEEQEPFHLNAYASLEEEGEEENPECLPCHTTGFNEDGKYIMEDEEEMEDFRFGYTVGADLELNERFQGVTCEACHGTYCGTFTKVKDIKPRCIRCHDETEIPHDAPEFDWEKAHAKTIHSFIGKKRTDVQFLKLPEKVRVDTSEFIGIDACGTCHVANLLAYEANQGIHILAFDDLPEDKQDDPECLRCHVTGFRAADGTYPMENAKHRKDRKKGFFVGNDEELNELYLGVQCEACHGAHCGFTRDPKVVKERCIRCHDGTCEHDEGDFNWEKDYAEVKHAAQKDATLGPVIVLDWWVSLKLAKEEARKTKKPILLFFLIPEL
ncbi:MAG: hypothetical protein E3J72_14695 [Planctomycetota bacterium]|nr:MAG: hypothetical protein E3J72_14695 [Planctomycetota bacterium]